jgi:PAS domain S-box-containing protein
MRGSLASASPDTGRVEIEGPAGGLIAAAGLGCSVAAIVVAASSPYGGARAIVGIQHALLIAVPIFVGLYALWRDAEPRFARLLIIGGFVWAPSLLAASSNSVAYSIGRTAAWIGLLALIALVFMFPTGRLVSNLDRGLVGALGVVLVLLYLPLVLLTVHYPNPSPWDACQHNCPPNAFAVVDHDPSWVHSGLEPLRSVLATLLFLGAAASLSLKISHASGPMRRTLVPALYAAVLALIGSAAFLVTRLMDQWSTATRVIGYVSGFALTALVLGFFLGLMRWRFLANRAVKRLGHEFRAATSGSHLRDLLAGAIRDPSLEIAYWTGHPGRWVDETGVKVELPRDDPRRAVTEVVSEGEPVAALIHDAALAGEPTVRKVASGFALMALENLRLDAELRSSLRDLRESRARILSAVDLERQRIERDLHDGAQQRLVALRVALELASETLRDNPEAADELLAKLGTDVEKTLDEVRALARGVYPPLLADHGIVDALRMAARASSLPVTVRSHGVGRYSQQIESAVYFCCLEAMQNAAKHSGAESATITLAEQDDLTFEIEDEGKGFALPRAKGGGMDNMRDRIVALGGKLTVESMPGEGTRVIGTVPVGLAQLTPDVASILQRATDALDDCFAIYRAVRGPSGEVVDFAVEHLNDAACRDTGRSREMQIGRTLGYLDKHYLGSELFEWERAALELDEPSLLDEVFYDRHSEGRRLRKAYEVRAVPMGASRLAVTWREITERKRNEDDLLLRSAVLNRAAEGVCLIRASDGVIVYANPRYEEIFGYGPGELEGRPFADLSWDQDAGVAARRYREVLTELERHGRGTFELLNRRKDGSPMWTEAHIATFDHPDHGQVWVSVKHDISERRWADEARQLAEHRLRIAMRDAPLVFYTMDRNLRYTWVLNNQVSLKGDESLIGKRDDELFEADLARQLSRLNRRALNGASVRAEVEIDLPDGSSTFDLTVNPLRGAGGQVMGVAGVAYSLTARESVGHLGIVADQSPLAMGVLDEELRFLETNRAFRDFVGYSPEELDGMKFGDVFGGFGNDTGDKLVADLRQGDSARPVAARVTTSSGASTPSSLIAFPVDGAGGAIGFVLDVPERAAQFVKPARFARGVRRS